MSQEIDFLLNNMSINDKEVFAFLKRLKITINSLEKSTLEYDDLKRLSIFMWELFSGWSFVTGYPKNDFFEEMLNKIKN